MISLVIIGTFGYYFLSDYNLIDALYMTVITVTTVGFGEVQPLDQAAKIFTIFLIITSISIYGYFVSVVSEYISNEKLFERKKLKKVQKQIQKLKNHTIVCGYGRNGKQAVATLKKFKKEVVVIEFKDERIEELEDDNLTYIKGDATLDDTLEKAGIEKASSLITALPSDANNLFVVLSARQLNKKLRIVSRASNGSSYSKLRIAGADNVIMPDKLGGEHMASLLVTPDIIEFVDMLSVDTEDATHLKEIAFEELPKDYALKSIRDLDFRRETGCTIIGFKTPDNEYIINPEAETKLIPNSKLIVLGRAEQILKLDKLL